MESKTTVANNSNKGAAEEPEGTIESEGNADDDEHDGDGDGNVLLTGKQQPPAYATNFDGHLPLHWLQPREPPSSHSSSSSGEILPSFRDLQLKTHRTLYGTASFGEHEQNHNAATMRLLPPSRDKSPKGSVDAPIQHLVDLINSHSRFCTLSSCSGRLSLFDPNGSSNSNSNNNNNNINNDGGSEANETNNNFTEASGKGRGSWVLVSHDRIDPEALVEAMTMASNGDPPGSTERTNTPTTTRNESNKSESESSCCSSEQTEGGGECDNDSESDDENPAVPHQAWTFRFEPLLLHVAAASLADGRKLLTVALNLGFRESGLVVTEKRVTVAIRSNSLSTVTPLEPAPVGGNRSSSSSSLFVPDSFLRALVHDANRRLEANWKHLDRLYRSIESVLFEIRSSPPPIVVRSSRSRSTDCGGPVGTGIPALNLWNASAIATTTTTCSTTGSGSDTNNVTTDPSSKTTRQQIWIAGGYGCGPSTSIHVSKNCIHNVHNNNNTAKRSSKLYQLEREFPHGSWKDGCWNEYDRSPWEIGKGGEDNGVGSLEITRGTNRAQTIQLNVRWFPKTNKDGASYPDLQGMASCRFADSNLVVAWGGRKSPARPAPADDLYIFDATKARFGTLEDVRGTLPRSRWGHQLIALGSSDRAVLLGGCNHGDGALDDVFVLHLCTEGCNVENGRAASAVHGYFYWEKLSIRLPTPRFHFGAAMLNEDTILMVGGLESTTKILQPFESDLESSSSTRWACRFGASKTKKNRKNGSIVGIRTKASTVTIETPGSVSLGSGPNASFGMTCCSLLSNNLLLVTGGIEMAAQEDEVPIKAFWISSDYVSSGVDRIRMQRIELAFDHTTGDDSLAARPTLDFGSLVHHCCIAISDNEVVMVGGGVPSFAFGECYAESYHLVIDVNNDSTSVKSGTKVEKNDLQSSSTKPIEIMGKSMNSPKPSFQNKAPKGSSFEGEPKQITDVVYVLPRDARKAKNLLQQKGWLDKRFRMIKVVARKTKNTENSEGGRDDQSAGESLKNSGATDEQVIAIPISIPSIEVLSAFDALILRNGEEELPFSTSQYASKIKQNN